MASRAARSSTTRSLRRALALLGAVVLLLGGVELALTLPGADPAWVVALTTVVGWVFVATGLLAWWRRPSNQLGALTVLGGLTVLLGGATSTQVPALVAVGAALATTPLAVLYHLVLAFPSGRVDGRAARVTVVGAYVVCLVLQAPLYLLDGSGAVPAALVLADRPDLLAAAATLQSTAGVVVTLATAAILVGRLRRAGPRQRLLLTPFFGYGVLAVLFVPLSANVLAPALGWSPAALGAAQLLVVLGVPVAFTAGVLSGGFAPTGELDELGVWLGEADARRPELAAALARTLGDPSLDVVWEPRGPRPAGADGTDRAWEEIVLDGRRVADIGYDPDLVADADLVRTAGRVVAIAADRERLTHELRSSRARLVDAADRERRRIAADLHDGLQVQLVLLAVQAQQVGTAPGATDAVRHEATALRRGIDDAARDLRELVHAVLPSALVERGLAAAAEDLLDRLPVPTRLELGLTDGTLPPSVETTAYFVLAEGLTNAVKHSGAATLAVRLVRRHDTLLVEVHDDGAGGAEPAAGTGLRGLADRVDVLGGRLDVRSTPGRGTRLRAELPCGS